MNRAWYKNIDPVLLFVWAGLVCVGLTAIYSATHGPAAEFLLDTVQKNFQRQAMWFGISGAVMAVILLIPATTVHRLSFLAYAVTTGLLVAALVFGREVNGAKSWVYIGSFGLQVSELAKVGTLLAVTRFLSKKEARRGEWKYLLGAAALLLVPAALIVLQNDTGTALVFMALVPILLFWSGAVSLLTMALIIAPAIAGYLVIVNPAWAGFFSLVFTAAMLVFSRNWLVAGASALASGGVALAAYIGLNKILKPHQVDRIVAFADPEQFASTTGFHVIQAKAAIGSGGVLGKGFTQGTQTQLAFIPEQSTDFVFTIVGEEFGFLGAAVVLTLFAFLLIRLATLGQRSAHAMPRLFAAGVAGIFLVHVIINIGMTIGAMPVIGIPLPFISYGGSALLANTTMIAITLNLYARRDEFSVYGR